MKVCCQKLKKRVTQVWSFYYFWWISYISNFLVDFWIFLSQQRPVSHRASSLKKYLWIIEWGSKMIFMLSEEEKCVSGDQEQTKPGKIGSTSALGCLMLWINSGNRSKPHSRARCLFIPLCKCFLEQNCQTPTLTSPIDFMCCKLLSNFFMKVDHQHHFMVL